MNVFKLGDYVIYRGKTYTFPGEVVAMSTDGQYMVRAFGDVVTNHYTGMKHIFGPAQLEPLNCQHEHEIIKDNWRCCTTCHTLLINPGGSSE